MFKLQISSMIVKFYCDRGWAYQLWFSLISTEKGMYLEFDGRFDF